MDSKSLDDIMSEREQTPVETIEQPATETTAATARDEKGRFASKDGEQPEAVTTEATEAQAEPGTVPQKALHASREREREAKQEAEALRQQIAQMQGQIAMLAQQRQPAQQAPDPVKNPDFWEDPTGFVNHALTPVQQQLQQQREQFSEAMAIDKYGKEAVSAAYQAMAQAVQQDPSGRAELQRIMATPHPYGELVTWHQRRQAMAEIGDPKAYRERLRAEIVAEMQASAAQQAPAAKTPMPTTFSSARNEGPRSTPAYSGPKPLSEIMDR